MRHTAKLWLWIFEFSDGTFRIAGDIAHVIVRWLGGRLVTRQDILCVVIERRDDGFVRLGVAAKQTFSGERLEIQPIEERAITFRRCARAR